MEGSLEAGRDGGVLGDREWRGKVLACAVELTRFMHGCGMRFDMLQVSLP